MAVWPIDLVIRVTLHAPGLHFCQQDALRYDDARGDLITCRTARGDVAVCWTVDRTEASHAGSLTTK